MSNIKKIWRDNTMPPTNYIWMKTNLKNELVGIYEWLDGKWRRIEIKTDSDTYTKQEIDYLLELTEQQIIEHILNGDYDLGITIDEALSETSKNPVENKVITAALNRKLDKEVYYSEKCTAIPEQDLPWN